MGTNVVSAEIVHRIERSKIDALRDCLPCFNFQWRLRAICGGWRNRLAFTSSYLKSKPGLPIGIVKLDIAPGQVGDRQCRHHRFIGDVLQSLEFQVHLNLPFCFDGKKENTYSGKNRSGHIL